MNQEIEKLEKHAQQVAERENCFLYDLELVGSGNNRILRIFIDKDGEEGVSIDDCSNVSRGLDLLLDVEDMIPGGSYKLEVSSPGLDRHLNKAWHYEKVKGQEIAVQLKAALGQICLDLPEWEYKRKKLTGTVVEANETHVTVDMAAKDDEILQLKLPYKQIQKAKVNFAFDKLYNHKKKNTKK